MLSTVFQKILLFSLLILGFGAFSETITTCEIKGKLELKENTQILCDQKDFTFQKNASIVTNGFQLILDAENATVLNIDIKCFEASYKGSLRDCGPIEVRSQILTGEKLNIDPKGINGGIGADVLLATETAYNLRGFVVDLGIGETKANLTITINAEETTVAQFLAKM